MNIKLNFSIKVSVHYISRLFFDQKRTSLYNFATQMFPEASVEVIPAECKASDAWN